MIRLMSPAILDYAVPTEFDTGRFVARYLQVLAWLSIASMVAGPILFRRFSVDLSFIFLFWAASALKRHSPAARKWVLGSSALFVVLLLGLLTQAVLFGTSGLFIVMGGLHIKNPSLWLLIVVLIPTVTIVAVPFVVLYSEKARRQFGGK